MRLTSLPSLTRRFVVVRPRILDPINDITLSLRLQGKVLTVAHEASEQSAHIDTPGEGRCSKYPNIDDNLHQVR